MHFASSKWPYIFPRILYKMCQSFCAYNCCLLSLVEASLYCHASLKEAAEMTLSTPSTRLKKRQKVRKTKAINANVLAHSLARDHLSNSYTFKEKWPPKKGVQTLCPRVLISASCHSLSQKIFIYFWGGFAHVQWAFGPSYSKKKEPKRNWAYAQNAYVRS